METNKKIHNRLTLTYHKSWDDAFISYLLSKHHHLWKLIREKSNLYEQINKLINIHYAIYTRTQYSEKLKQQSRDKKKVRLVPLIDFQRWCCFHSKREMNASSQLLWYQGNCFHTKVENSMIKREINAEMLDRLISIAYEFLSLKSLKQNNFFLFFLSSTSWARYIKP